MRNGNKASLFSFLIKVVPSAIYLQNSTSKWWSSITNPNKIAFIKFSSMHNLHEKDLYSKYRYCYVVFDCCGSGPSTKDIQHTNRSGKDLSDITFTSDKKCVKSQEDFLDNQNNKVHCVAGFRNHSSQNGLVEEADTAIAKIVLECTLF